jgi:hypothetical protein
VLVDGGAHRLAESAVDELREGVFVEAGHRGLKISSSRQGRHGRRGGRSPAPSDELSHEPTRFIVPNLVEAEALSQETPACRARCTVCRTIIWRRGR